MNKRNRYDEFIRTKQGNRCAVCDKRINLNLVKMRQKNAVWMFQYGTSKGWFCLDCAFGDPDDDDLV